MVRRVLLAAFFLLAKTSVAGEVRVQGDMDYYLIKSKLNFKDANFGLAVPKHGTEYDGIAELYRMKIEDNPWRDLEEDNPDVRGLIYVENASSRSARRFGPIPIAYKGALRPFAGSMFSGIRPLLLWTVTDVVYLGDSQSLEKFYYPELGTASYGKLGGGGSITFWDKKYNTVTFPIPDDVIPDDELDEVDGWLVLPAPSFAGYADPYMKGARVIMGTLQKKLLRARAQGRP